MRKFLAIAAAAAALTFATAASAQNPPLYVMGPDGQRYVTGGDKDMPILPGGDAGAKPADCPEGSYFLAGDNIIAACFDDSQRFTLMAPETGVMQPDGKPYPEGAMLMQPFDPAAQESGDSKQSEGASQTGG